VEPQNCTGYVRALVRDNCVVLLKPFFLGTDFDLGDSNPAQQSSCTIWRVFVSQPYAHQPSEVSRIVSWNPRKDAVPPADKSAPGLAGPALLPLLTINPHPKTQDPQP
jgi:hypothetical protein